MLTEYLKSRRDKECFGKSTEAPKEVKKIPIKSLKRKVEEKLYLKKKKEYLVKHIRCEVKGCNKVGETLHHKKGRIGKLLYDDRYFMAVCFDHHRRIEDDPLFAKENGFSLSRLKN